MCTCGMVVKKRGHETRNVLRCKGSLPQKNKTNKKMKTSNNFRMKTSALKKCCGAGRWLSSWEHCPLFQRTQVGFPAPHSPHDSSQPVTPGPGCPTPFSGFPGQCTHVGHRQTCRQNMHRDKIKIIKNKYINATINSF